MKYCVYVSKTAFDKDKIAHRLKALIKKNDDSDYEILYHHEKEKETCYAFIKERNVQSKEFVLKAMLYI